MLIRFILAVVITEAMTEIVVESVLLSRLRAGFTRVPVLGYLVSCGYCLSVWLGVGAAYLLRMEGALEGLGAVEPVLWGVVVHRASNVLHEGISRFMGRVPWALFLNVRGSVPVDVQIPLEESPVSPLRVDEALLDADTENIADLVSPVDAPPNENLSVIDAEDPALREDVEKEADVGPE